MVHWIAALELLLTSQSIFHTVGYMQHDKTGYMTENIRKALYAEYKLSSGTNGTTCFDTAMHHQKQYR